ncbi:MAG: glycerate kinase [Chloroflexota bacterium]|nr:glycerate kinase [Chloroflexota bacterium]MDE3194123.1 glycerate kinase [Chloroflexota bacterium]
MTAFAPGTPLRVLIAPQAFKGSCDAVAVAAAIARGLRRMWPDVVCDELPLADGGEGTVHALVAATNGTIQRSRVHDPLGREIEAEWGILGDRRTAVVEMAAASGLPLLRDDERDPRVASTRGTGELILAAATTNGIGRVLVGIGGSATNDGGTGMARTVGFRFVDREGQDLPEGGAALARLQRIEGQTDARLLRVSVEVASDVRNPLVGPEGASAVFGPQKGATPDVVRELDAALTRYADVLARFLGRDIRDVPGAGAAGGLGAGLMAFADAKMRSGADVVMTATRFAERARSADLVITGEGRVDAQSAYGKVTGAVIAKAKELGRPSALIAGGVAEGHGALFEAGLGALEIASDGPSSVQDAMRRADTLIASAAERLARSIALGRQTAVGATARGRG